MSNIRQLPAKEWLEELFDSEYCCECGGDENHHTAVPHMGNWFARCDYPPDCKEIDGREPELHEIYHPVIAKYRKIQDKKTNKGD